METIGKIEVLKGDVTVTHADGTSEVLAVGSDVYQGDQIETGTDGSIGVVLLDNTTFSMGEAGHMTLDEMVYDPATQEGSIAMDLASGVFNFENAEMVWLTEDTKITNKSDFDNEFTVIGGGEDVDIKAKGKDWHNDGEVQHNGDSYSVFSNGNEHIAIDTDNM